MNVICYRRPSDSTAHILQCGTPIREWPVAGAKWYCIHPFLPEEGFFFYPIERELSRIPEISILPTTKDSNNLSFTQYCEYLSDIKRFIDGEETRKIVASRRKILSTTVNATLLFEKLCARFPEAFVFLIHTREHGLWIGASPELLLKKRGTTVETMALAGTRQVGSHQDWDEKNIKEQAIVTAHIADILGGSGLNVTIGETMTKAAGPIEHICTPIKGEIIDIADICEMLNLMSPTPALAGYPKEEAIELIKKHETDGRALYGGFSGPVEGNGDCDFFVTLRCAKLEQDRCILYAGGGVTYLSDEKEEWEETEKKFSTLEALISI